MNTYVIFIDDELYESSDNFEIAKYLYNTIDASCLAKYNGHRKLLMARIDGINYHIKREIISQSANNAVRHASPAMIIRTAAVLTIYQKSLPSTLGRMAI